VRVCVLSSRHRELRSTVKVRGGAVPSRHCGCSVLRRDKILDFANFLLYVLPVVTSFSHGFACSTQYTRAAPRCIARWVEKMQQVTFHTSPNTDCISPTGMIGDFRVQEVDLRLTSGRDTAGVPTRNSMRPGVLGRSFSPFGTDVPFWLSPILPVSNFPNLTRPWLNFDRVGRDSTNSVSTVSCSTLIITYYITSIP